MSLDSIKKTTEVTQATHDNLNLNANLQIGNVDASSGNPVPVDTELPAPALITDNQAIPTVSKIQVFPMVFDGSTWDMMRGDASQGIGVSGSWDEGEAYAPGVQSLLMIGCVETNTDTVVPLGLNGNRELPVANAANQTDNQVFTDGTSKIAISGYIFDETAGTALTENDGAAARIDSKRAQVFVVEDETTRGRRVTVTAAKAMRVDAKTALTASAPTAATVGITSAQAVASAATRQGLILTNTSINTISFGIGATAVLNSGITLPPGGVWVMDEFNFTTGAINAIASAASSNLAIQEFTT